MSTAPVPIDTSEEGLAKLLQGFESCTITHPEWTHEAHVLVALKYALTSRDPLTMMRDGIHKLLAAFGIVTTEMRGYHETITHCYVATIWDYVQTQRRQNPGKDVRACELAEGVLALATRELPLSYYSRELLFSSPARFGFVQPDLRPLPPLPSA